MAHPAASASTNQGWFARPVAAIPLTAIAQVAFALLGWGLLVGGLCGSSDTKIGTLLAAWLGPALLAFVLGRFGLRASLLSALLGVAAGFALTFAVFLGIVFPACG